MLPFYLLMNNFSDWWTTLVSFERLVHVWLEYWVVLKRTTCWGSFIWEQTGTFTGSDCFFLFLFCLFSPQESVSSKLGGSCFPFCEYFTNPVTRLCLFSFTVSVSCGLFISCGGNSAFHLETRLQRWEPRGASSCSGRRPLLLCSCKCFLFMVTRRCHGETIPFQKT